MRTSQACTDRRGQTISAGANARILVIPDWLTHDVATDDVARLKAAEGTVMRILEIDTHGYVWFGTDNLGRWFCLRPEEVEVVA